jgi:D-alanyl-D-alanine carboxypeptidase
MTKKIKEFFQMHFTRDIAMTFAGLALVAISLGYTTSVYIATEEAKITAEIHLQNTSLAYTQTLLKKGEQIEDLSQKLSSERASTKSLEGQVGTLNSNVIHLEKYALTDKQLLEKYSKIYFLNENYIPEGLETIDNKYNFEKSRTLEFHQKAYPFLVKLMEQAKANDMNLQIASAYRSFGTQSSLKSSYKVIYGAKTANSFSADQGYSEHQLGTTIDFTTPAVGGALTGFEKTKEYKWLLENAYKYGFIISYPASNTYYVFEPWHFRFVGVALATRLHNEKKNFYDMDQRDINEYLVQLFDEN